MGWIPDLPDARDYTFQHECILPLLRRLAPASRELPDEVDLCSDDEGNYFSGIEDQGALNSSTAFAVLGLIEYFERRIYGRTCDPSKQFLYRVARNLRTLPAPHSATPWGGQCCDDGADLRTTLKAVVQFGIVPEQHWPYQVDRFHSEPTRFVYGTAKSAKSLRYFRLDQRNSDGAMTCKRIESFVAAGFPLVFGFSVPSSLSISAEIPYRPESDVVRGGQAAMVVGYRRHHFGPKQHALRVRLSWGSDWGDCGSGWLPAAYVQQQLARDFWTCIHPDWFKASSQRGRPVDGELRCPIEACSASSPDATAAD